METFARVVRQGNSLMIAITKPLREMGLDAGDWVKVEIYRPNASDFSAMPLKYDPTPVGELIVRSTEGNDYTEAQLRQLIETYDPEPSHIELILQYIMEYRREKR